MENELKPCPFCECKAIYEVEREDLFIGHYPQIFCNGCKITFEIENDSPYLNNTTTYNYLREKLIKAWNRRCPDGT